MKTNTMIHVTENRFAALSSTEPAPGVAITHHCYPSMSSDFAFRVDKPSSRSIPLPKKPCEAGAFPRKQSHQGLQAQRSPATVIGEGPSIQSSHSDSKSEADKVAFPTPKPAEAPLKTGPQDSLLHTPSPLVLGDSRGGLCVSNIKERASPHPGGQSPKSSIPQPKVAAATSSPLPHRRTNSPPQPKVQLPPTPVLTPKIQSAPRSLCSTPRPLSPADEEPEKEIYYVMMEIKKGDSQLRWKPMETKRQPTTSRVTNTSPTSKSVVVEGHEDDDSEDFVDEGHASCGEKDWSRRSSSVESDGDWEWIG